MKLRVTEFTTRSVPTNPRLLFASSRSVAPAFTIKPNAQPNNSNNLSTHAVILPPILPNNILPTVTANVLPSSGPVQPSSPQTPQLPQSPGLPRVQGDEEEISDEAFSGALQDLALSVGIWEHVLQTDEDATPPPPCSCHSLPIGSCPESKQQLVNQISLCSSYGVPNMDGARSPLVNPSFQHKIWRDALGSYFDADEIAKAIQYGWDPSFTSRPFPKDAVRNNASALQFPEHVLHYVDKELGFGALVGPFHPSELPFQVFRSPFGSVKKIGSKWRRTVTDCSQLSSGINAYIDPRYHRGSPWKLTLPNSMSIIQAILKTRQKFPGHRVFIWKLDMARWYRWIQRDPAVIKYFAVMWEGKHYLDTCLSFGDRCAALAAQRFI